MCDLVGSESREYTISRPKTIYAKLEECPGMNELPVLSILYYFPLPVPLRGVYALTQLPSTRLKPLAHE